MEDTINSIRQALYDKNYLAALALALTIPDVCGHVEYPSEKNVGKRYTDWCDKYFDDEFNGTATKNNPYNIPMPPRFNAVDCYELRCAVLHSGNTDMDLNKVNFNKFKLYKEKSTHTGVEWIDGNTQSAKSFINLNITHFCETMCDVAEKYYNSRKSGFAKYHISIQ